MIQYATLIADHLIESRRAGLPYGRAFDRATAQNPPEPDWPLAEMRRWMEQGYHRQRVGRIGGNAMSALTVRDRCYVDDEYVAPEFQGARVCGWGLGCDEPARESGWLCDAHKARVRVPAVKPLCLHPECHQFDLTVPNNALPNDDFCKKHRAQVDALEVHAETVAA